jgi:Holliday junction resolvase-like predicted endonuclease
MGKDAMPNSRCGTEPNQKRTPNNDVEKFSSSLDWRKFEEYVESAFASFGYQTQRSVRLRKPPAEIDLVASKGIITFAVDCKHWKKTVGRATMLGVSKRQIARAKRYLQGNRGSSIVPILVTLHDEYLHILENGVPVVPIYRITDFILNWEQARNDILILA